LRLYVDVVVSGEDAHRPPHEWYRHQMDVLDVVVTNLRTDGGRHRDLVRGTAARSLHARRTVRTLVGLGLNSLFGWSWADPIAALVIAAVAVKEGRGAWRGDACCAVSSASQLRSRWAAVHRSVFDRARCDTNGGSYAKTDGVGSIDTEVRGPS